jgi:hypothetical protein
MIQVIDFYMFLVPVGPVGPTYKQMNKRENRR